MNIMNNITKSFFQYYQTDLRWLTLHGMTIAYESTTKDPVTRRYIASNAILFIIFMYAYYMLV